MELHYVKTMPRIVFNDGRDAVWDGDQLVLGNYELVLETKEDMEALFELLAYMREQGVF